MLDLLGIDLDNNDADKNGAVAADPWGMPIKTQPQPQSQVIIHLNVCYYEKYLNLLYKRYR